MQGKICCFLLKEKYLLKTFSVIIRFLSGNLFILRPFIQDELFSGDTRTNVRWYKIHDHFLSQFTGEKLSTTVIINNKNSAKVKLTRLFDITVKVTQK